MDGWMGVAVPPPLWLHVVREGGGGALVWFDLAWLGLAATSFIYFKLFVFMRITHFLSIWSG
jgi:hypothetical protein